MKIKPEAMDHVLKECQKVHHGEVTIVLNETSGQITVVTTSRNRFFVDPVASEGAPEDKSKSHSRSFRQG